MRDMATRIAELQARLNRSEAFQARIIEKQAAIRNILQRLMNEETTKRQKEPTPA